MTGGLAVAAAGLMALSATPALAGSTVPGVGEDRSSRMNLITNIPAQAPLDATGSDLAFQGDYAYQGNYNGFNVIDLSTPTAPVVAAAVLCPGSQNDISVYGDLLFLSTDSRRTDDSCSSSSVPSSQGTDYWEGMKIFDISDPTNPEYVKAVETKCGSHTHTLVPGNTADEVYLYVSSYDISTVAENCQAPHDLISVIEVPLAAPTEAAVVAEQVVFPDGGNPGDPVGTPTVDRTRATAGCHDITVYPDKDLAAGACMGDGVLWDITDRSTPREINRVQDDENFAFWHSATFNNDGTKVVFTDELGGGGAATCVPGIPDTRGANGIYDVAGEGDDRELTFASYYKIPRDNSDTENCVAHNGSLIPVPGRDIMVQAWYMGGISVFDFTDSANPVEIAYYDRGPVAAGDPTGGGTWSAYWYNGYVYASDLGKGFDVYSVNAREVARAKPVVWDIFNAQTQPTYTNRIP